ncbi:MAG: hypothetical protein NVS2B9_05590 [Myxococcales bacterium]
MLAPLALLLAAGSVLPFPPGETRTINVLQWDTNQLPRIYQRSDQLPLTDDEVAQLAQGGFDSAQIVKMIEERRCACDASAAGLLRLKQRGVPKEVLSALSLHALRPNRALQIAMMLDFSGDGRSARESFLYFFVDDGKVTRVLTANLNDLLGQKRAHESLVDRSDLLIERQVRRIELAGSVPLKSYGKHTVLVASSANPTLTHPSQLSELERSKAQTYSIDYPRASLENLCRLTAGYRRDPVLADRWNFQGSRFECEWN